MNLPAHIQLLSSDPTNVYLFKDGDEAAVIDPYWVDPEKGVRELIRAVQPQRLTTSIITHAHFDHYGGCSALNNKLELTTSAHVADAWIMEDSNAYFKQVYSYENPTHEKIHSLMSLAGGKGVKVNRILRDGDCIEVGQRSLNVIHVPGHSHGSISLMDPEEGTLFTGDTPFPSDWLPSWLGLVVDAQNYEASLKKLVKMRPRLALPGHGRILSTDEWRRELRLHINHLKVCEETILSILKEEVYTPLESIRDGMIQGILTAVNKDDVIFRATEWSTIHSIMQKLCLECKTEQGRGLVWRRI